jgi:hypothetical protein
MRFPLLVSIVWVAWACSLRAQGSSFQQREVLSTEARVSQLEERLAARSEDVKNLLGDIAVLKTELKTVREQAKSAEDLSKSNQDRLDQFSGIGRLILGSVAFLIGSIVTQFVSKWMAGRGASKARVAPTPRFPPSPPSAARSRNGSPAAGSRQ